MLGSVASSRHRSRRDGENLGRELQELRIRAAKSLAEAAAELGLSASTLAYIEQDGRVIQPAHLKKLLDYYEAPLSKRHRALMFFGDPEDMRAPWSGIAPKGAGLERSHPIEASTQRAFLCHSSGDKERVRALYRRLQTDGVSCWFDEEDLLPGQDWEYEIGKAIQASRFVLACLSKSSTTRAGYLQRELRKALDVADGQPEGSTFLIPVRLEKCEIPERLRRWQWVDLFGESGYERLLRVLRADQNSGN
jgi:transcriptional regulator with XRE-family HTH domain